MPILDINFCFDPANGNLKTDLYVKETDSRSYLHFGSCHPNHIYSGIVFSQCLRLRRIINDNTRLKQRLSELEVSFKKCRYPTKMIQNISKKVQSLERNINEEKKKKENGNKIRVISTYGCDSDLVSSVKNIEKDLRETKSFSSKMVPCKSENKENSLFTFVKKTGPNLKQKLVKVKQYAVGDKFGKFRPCGAKKTMIVVNWEPPRPVLH